MGLDRHPEWYTVIRENWHRTTGFLLASREPCLSIRAEELAAIGENRALVGREVKDLQDWKPPESWVLGVLVCPGDDVLPVVEWVRRERADPERVWFFLHPETDVEVLRPWVEAGFDVGRVDVVGSWRELHRLFGLALNDRVYGDWSPRS